MAHVTWKAVLQALTEHWMQAPHRSLHTQQISDQRLACMEIEVVFYSHHSYTPQISGHQLPRVMFWQLSGTYFFSKMKSLEIEIMLYIQIQ